MNVVMDEIAKIQRVLVCFAGGGGGGMEDEPQ